MRGFMDDRTTDRWRCLLRETETSTTLEHRQECSGVDPSGGAQRINDGTEGC